MANCYLIRCMNFHIAKSESKSFEQNRPTLKIHIHLHSLPTEKIKDRMKTP